MTTTIYDYGVIPKDYNNQDVRLVRLGASEFTVGNKGYFSSLADAINASNAVPHVLLQEITAGATSTGGKLGREISLSTALTFSITDETELLCKVGTGSYFIARPYSTNRLVAKHAIENAFTGQDIAIYRPVYRSIFITPGTVLDVATAVGEIQSCTTVYGLRGASCVRSELGANSALFSAGTGHTEITFAGLKVTSRGAVASTQSFKIGAAIAQGELTDFRISDCDINMSAYDAIYMGDGNNGHIRIDNNFIQVRYDGIRLAGAMHGLIFGNVIIAESFDAENESTAACIAYTTAGAGIAAVSVQGNRLFSDATDSLAYGSTALSAPVDIRQANSNLQMQVIGNYIDARARDGAEYVCGVGALLTVASVTPEINVHGNVFNVRRDGGGANVYSIANVNANYVMRSSSNTTLAGGVATLSANVTSATPF